MSEGTSNGFHVPVMVTEVFESLNLKPGDTYVDGTLGHAGHALEAAERISPGGTIYGFDWDEEMLGKAKKRTEASPSIKWNFYHASFFEAPEILANLGVNANGILLDLGLNSGHVDDPKRGFSFKEGPLSMKMDTSAGEPASALLNRMTPHEIESVLLNYGGERWARAIAKQIVLRRKESPLRTTTDLIECVLAAVPAAARDKRIHPATRTFQAIRILTNGELDGLEAALQGLRDRLAVAGVMVVLSYHSGEDRIVKLFTQESRNLKSDLGPKYEVVYRKPLTPSAQEVHFNHRARSAKLRAIRRVA